MGHAGWGGVLKDAWGLGQKGGSLTGQAVPPRPFLGVSPEEMPKASMGDVAGEEIQGWDENGYKRGFGFDTGEFP